MNDILLEEPVILFIFLLYYATENIVSYVSLAYLALE